MSIQTSFKSAPKKDIDLGKSFLELIAYEAGSLAKVKKASTLPEDAWKDLEFTDREPSKTIAEPLGYGKTRLTFGYKKGITAFSMHEGLRKALTLDATKLEKIHLDLGNVNDSDAKRIVNAIGNWISLSTYEFPKYGKKNSKKTKTSHALEVWVSSKSKVSSLEPSFSAGVMEGKSANLVRYLAELPGNELQPKHYIERIKDLAKGWGAKFEFLDQAALKKRGAEAFLAVVRANPKDPYGIVHLSYKPKSKSKKKIALVGKGLCFDTGGYNVKVGDYMYEMHRDMTGSAVALALFGHLIEMNAPYEVHAYLALAENLISPTAYRPNDVVVASNGVSIEVVDTDAEGRMVLSDTLVYACENKPDFIIDYATLTGAVIRAIDTRRSGVFSNSEKLLKTAVAAGEETGERVWPFPIGHDYWEGISSEIADVRQCGHGNNADHIYAATFLSSFVKPEIPWLHVDLAAESHKGGLGLSARDVTGYGIRLSKAIIENFKS